MLADRRCSRPVASIDIVAGVGAAAGTLGAFEAEVRIVMYVFDISYSRAKNGAFNRRCGLE